MIQREDCNEMQAESPFATDVTLIDAMLALTPEERLRQNDRMLETIRELRDGLAACSPDDPPRAAGRDSC